MGRAPCCEKVGLKRGRWTAEEDEILTKYIQANGEGSWRSLPKNAGLLRCGKSCRLRWINYLRSDLKRGNISAEEEEIIINLHASLGNRWSLIAGHLPGRTDNEIKNYWNSHLSKKLHSFKTSENDSLPAAPEAAVMDLAKPEILVKKRKGSRSSRSNMKKNKCSNIPSQSREEMVPPDPANATVQMPRTPTLEKETLSSAISWEEENINKAIMDPCPNEERTENLVDAPPEDEESKTSLMLQSAAKFTSSDLWATCNVCLDDVIMGNGELADPDGILSFHGNKETCGIVASDDQREHGGGTRTTTTDMDPGCCRRQPSNDRQDLETDKLEIMEVSDVGNCEWSVSSPAHDGKLYDWDDWQWDVEDVQNNLTTLGDKADMLSWLWDSDNNNDKGDCDDDGPSPGAEILDDEKHNAIVAWLLS